MKVRAIVQAGFAVLLLTATALGQQPPEAWHSNGTLAFGYYHTTQNAFLPVTQPNSASAYQTIFSELRLDLNGYLQDPQLLPFSLNFDALEGSNDVDVNNYRNSLHNWGFNTTFLPARPFPLRVYYQKSQFSANGSIFGQNADTANLGVNWTLRMPRAPNVNVDFTQFKNTVRLATSLLESNYDQKRFAVGVDDTWKGWVWATSYEHYQNNSNFADFLSLPGNYQENLNVFGARLRRVFWDNKAQFNAENRSQWRHDDLPTAAASDSSDMYTSATLNIQHTSKLSSDYFYNYMHVNTGTSLVPGAGSGNPGSIAFLLVPTFNSDYAGARVQYRLTDHIRLFQAIRYQYATPPSSQQEYSHSVTETLSGIGAQKSWHHFDVDGSYVAHFQLMDTNFGNHAHTFSNDMYGRAAWGDVRKVRLTLSGNYSKLNLVQQLNGFSDDRRIRLEAETRPWQSYLFRLTAERSHIELLNLSGDVRQDTTGFGFQVEHPRFSANLSRLLQDGAGALFPGFVQDQFVVSQPLPINLLFGTPLLNRSAHTNAATLILRLRQNLDFNAHYRDEKDNLTASRFTFQEEEIRLRYRIGKITLDGGYGQYKNESFAQTNSSGVRTNRALFRIARDFRVF